MRARPASAWQDLGYALATSTTEAAFFVTDGEAPAGFVTVTLGSEEPVADLPMLYVGEVYRRRGFGLALLNAALKFAASSGARRAALWVTTSNQAALRLYEGAGFIETGERRSLKPEAGHLQARMEFSLTPKTFELHP